MTEQKLPDWLYVGAAVRWKCAGPSAVYFVLEVGPWSTPNRSRVTLARIVCRAYANGPDLALPIWVNQREISPVSLVEAAGLLAGGQETA